MTQLNFVKPNGLKNRLDLFYISVTGIILPVADFCLQGWGLITRLCGGDGYFLQCEKPVGCYGTTLWAMIYLKLLCYFAPFCVA